MGFSGPPHDWQDTLTDLIASRASSDSTGLMADGPSASSSTAAGTIGTEDLKPSVNNNYAPDSFNPHQRRRIDSRSPPTNTNAVAGPSTRPPTGSSKSSTKLPRSCSRTPPHCYRSSPETDPDTSDESDLADAVGQLSINDMHQVRYHGKASGLHLLMPAMQASSDSFPHSYPPPNHPSSPRKLSSHVDGGIWKFPPAGVWPPVPSKDQRLSASGPYSALKSAGADADIDVKGSIHLPDKEKRGILLGLYFTYVHPILPVVQKRQFLEDYANRFALVLPRHVVSVDG